MCAQRGHRIVRRAIGVGVLQRVPAGVGEVRRCREPAGCKRHIAGLRRRDGHRDARGDAQFELAIRRQQGHRFVDELVVPAEADEHLAEMLRERIGAAEHVRPDVLQRVAQIAQRQRRPVGGEEIRWLGAERPAQQVVKLPDREAARADELHALDELDCARRRRQRRGAGQPDRAQVVVNRETQHRGQRRVAIQRDQIAEGQLRHAVPIDVDEGSRLQVLDQRREILGGDAQNRGEHRVLRRERQRTNGFQRQRRARWIQPEVAVWRILDQRVQERALVRAPDHRLFGGGVIVIADRHRIPPAGEPADVGAEQIVQAPQLRETAQRRLGQRAAGGGDRAIQIEDRPAGLSPEPYEAAEAIEVSGVGEVEPQPAGVAVGPRRRERAGAAANVAALEHVQELRVAQSRLLHQDRDDGEHVAPRAGDDGAVVGIGDPVAVFLQSPVFPRRRTAVRRDVARFGEREAERLARVVVRRHPAARIAQLEQLQARRAAPLQERAHLVQPEVERHRPRENGAVEDGVRLRISVLGTRRDVLSRVGGLIRERCDLEPLLLIDDLQLVVQRNIPAVVGRGDPIGEPDRQEADDRLLELAMVERPDQAVDDRPRRQAPVQRVPVRVEHLNLAELPERIADNRGDAHRAAEHDPPPGSRFDDEDSRRAIQWKVRVARAAAGRHHPVRDWQSAVVEVGDRVIDVRRGERSLGAVLVLAEDRLLRVPQHPVARAVRREPVGDRPGLGSAAVRDREGVADVDGAAAEQAAQRGQDGGVDWVAPQIGRWIEFPRLQNRDRQTDGVLEHFENQIDVRHLGVRVLAGQLEIGDVWASSQQHRQRRSDR